MSVTFNDILQQTDDLLSNYNVTNIDLGNKKRAINRAIERVQRQLGLPSDKKIYSFYYYEDTDFYDMPTGFNELIQLYYNNSSIVDSDHNTFINRWYIYRDIELLNSSGKVPNQNKVAFTTLNGKNQLLLQGRNFRGSSIINSFDSTSGLTFSADISGETIDSYVKKQGSGSLKFNIATGLSTTTVSFTGLWDISSLIEINGAYKLYIDFPTGTSGYFTNVKLQLQSSTGNYYEMTSTTQDDGTAWTEAEWNRLKFSLSAATQTGSPDATQINQINIVLTHSGSFSTTTGIRLDYLYQINPDYMNTLYYSAYKGTDTTGNTDKIILTETSDIVSFGSYASDLIMPISLLAATILNPQLRADINFNQIYKNEYTEVMKLFGRTYPRTRTVTSGKTEILR